MCVYIRLYTYKKEYFHNGVWHAWMIIWRNIFHLARSQFALFWRCIYIARLKQIKIKVNFTHTTFLTSYCTLLSLDSFLLCLSLPKAHGVPKINSCGSMNKFGITFFHLCSCRVSVCVIVWLCVCEYTLNSIYSWLLSTFKMKACDFLCGALLSPMPTITVSKYSNKF